MLPITGGMLHLFNFETGLRRASRFYGSVQEKGKERKGKKKFRVYTSEGFTGTIEYIACVSRFSLITFDGITSVPFNMATVTKKVLRKSK